MLPLLFIMRYIIDDVQHMDMDEETKDWLDAQECQVCEHMIANYRWVL